MISIKKIVKPAFFVFVATVLWSSIGCYSIEMSYRTPGEFKLSGVSKIAIVDFNTLADDPVAGVKSADKEITGIVQQMVASTFDKGKIYKVADLDIEKMIQSNPANRFDAVIYGRVWFQSSPEINTTYPKVYVNEKWNSVEYQIRKDDGTAETKGKWLLTETEEKLFNVAYRAKNASLMVSLTVYKLDKNGLIEKMVDTYAISSDKFILDNGNNGRIEELSLSSVGKGVNGSSAFFESQSASVPTELQTKLVLADRIAVPLSQSMASSEVKEVQEISLWASWFMDNKLFFLLTNGAFAAIPDYVAFKMNNELAKELAEEILSWPQYTDDKPASEILIKQVKKYRDEIFYYALACEQIDRTEEALDVYLFLFNIDHDEATAQAISRCRKNLKNEARLKEKAKDAKKATRRAGLK